MWQFSTGPLLIKIASGNTLETGCYFWLMVEADLGHRELVIGLVVVGQVIKVHEALVLGVVGLPLGVDLHTAGDVDTTQNVVQGYQTILGVSCLVSVLAEEGCPYEARG